MLLVEQWKQASPKVTEQSKSEQFFFTRSDSNVVNLHEVWFYVILWKDTWT